MSGSIAVYGEGAERRLGSGDGLLTEADKARFKNEADELALRWLRNIVILEDEAAWDTTTNPSNPIYIDSNNTNEYRW